MPNHNQQLVKILVGAAWLDGSIQPEERAYLQRIIVRKELQDDADLNLWISGARSVSPEDCFKWISDYLGQSPTPESCQELLEEISGLIYSDSEIDSKEAELLMQLQQLNEKSSSGPKGLESVAGAVNKLYRKWVKA